MSTKLAQSVGKPNEAVSAYRRFKDYEKQLQDAKALAKAQGHDEHIAEMIAR